MTKVTIFKERFKKIIPVSTPPKRGPEQTIKETEYETYIEETPVRITGDPFSPTGLIPPNVVIIRRYQGGYKNMATITIYFNPEDGRYAYIIDEPPISPEALQLFKIISERLRSMSIDIPQNASLKEKESIYEEKIREALAELGLEAEGDRHPELFYYLIRNRVGWKEIDVPMRDSLVEEISIESYKSFVSVVVRDPAVKSRWVDTNIKFDTEQQLTSFIEFLAFRVGKQISVATPILEARTPEGYRLAANLKEVSGSPAFTIRKFPEEPRSLIFLIRNKTLSPLMAAYLWTMVENYRFIMIIGGMASGKTTMLQALTSAIPRDTKVVTIEDTPELRLDHPRWQALYTRTAIYGTEQSITLFDLARYSLRTRAQYIIIGEVRDREIQTLVQMAASGHGSMCLRPSEKIVIKEDGVVKTVELGSVVERVRRLLSRGLRPNIRVPSLTPTGRVAWRRIVDGRPLQPSTAWYRVELSNGVYVDATGDHEFLVVNHQGIVRIPVERLKPGMTVPILSGGEIGLAKIKTIRDIDIRDTPYDIEVEIDHNFMLSNGLFVGNCTFHAEDPYTLFIRLTSPPLSVQEAFLVVIHVIVLQGYVFSKKYKSFIRRTLRTWEITGVKRGAKPGEIPVEYIEVFRWDPMEDKHYPDNVDDLLDKSFQLKVVGKMNYGEEFWRDMLREELEEKTRFLKEMAEKGIVNYREVTEHIYRKTLELRGMIKKAMRR